eukprot:GFUD01040236.1.p1 GENE.GFUD01040236.1~~GFUD01040236.1.p1  ORF type:complete len:141 (+),score=48.14 GFUD01040236.1:52-423(+)
MSAGLFRETSAQRFSRESQEMWKKVQTGDSFANISRASHVNGSTEGIPDRQEASNKEDPQPVRKVQTKSPSLQARSDQGDQGDIFPRKVKSKFVNIKPAIWEKTEENLKKTILKKEKRETKLG